MLLGQLESAKTCSSAGRPTSVQLSQSPEEFSGWRMHRGCAAEQICNRSESPGCTRQHTGPMSKSNRLALGPLLPSGDVKDTRFSVSQRLSESPPTPKPCD